jgi:hypothetical protein
MKRIAVDHVGTKAERRAARDAEPWGYHRVNVSILSSLYTKYCMRDARFVKFDEAANALVL